jgi:serine/threonine protein kinase
LIDASGDPLICDFGLVSIIDTERPDRGADNTTTVHNGTVRYLAYELAQDPPAARTMASDIHALGCIAYEVSVYGLSNDTRSNDIKFLYLERPYSSRSGNGAGFYIFKDIAAGKPPARRHSPQLAPSIAALWSLLDLCWDPEPHRRLTISAFSTSLRLLTENELQHHLW